MTNCICNSNKEQLKIEQGENLLRKAGLLEFSQHIAQIDSEITQGHQKISKIERAIFLGIDIGESEQLSAERNFSLARRHAAESRRYLQNRYNNSEWQQFVISVDEMRISGELEAKLSEAEERWREVWLNTNFPVQDIEEILGIWYEQVELLKSEGIDSLFDRLDGWLGEFEAILQPDQNWGRQPHSPLEWWEWLLMAAILGIFIGLLIACAIFSGCSWIKAAFAALCGLVLPSGKIAPGVCLGILF